MGELMQRVASQQVLLDAWNDVRRRTTADGVEPEEVREFATTAARSIARLSSQLGSLTWTPGPVRPARVPKPDGGYRELGIPTLADRIVERAVLSVLDPLVDPVLLPWSFAYRRGLGTQDALRALVDLRDDGARFAVRGDFTACFERVPHRALLATIRELVDDSELFDLIVLLVKRPVMGRRPRGRGLHQGAPTSPLLTNVFLDRFDRALLRAGYVVVRYADDFVVPVADEGTARRVLGLVQREAAAIGMELGPGKTSIRSFDEGVPFLGAFVTAATTPPATRYDHPTATTVYVTTPGSTLRSRGHRMRVEFPSEEDEPFSIAYDRIRQVVLFGRANVTTPLLRQLLERGIDLTLLSDQGRYFGRLQGAESSNPFLRAAQYALATDRSKQLDLARRMVTGKITNQRALLLRRQRSTGIRVDVSVERLAASRRRVATAQTVNELMGIEGAATREYHQAFGALLTGPFEFTVRRRRPPPDPVNSMLSFGYTLLVQELISAVETAGLDSAEGVLHARRVGRPSLALDLVEEFRPVIVDSVVLRMVNTGAVGPDDFEYPDVTPPMCRLTDDARRAFLREYERRQLTITTHAGSGRRVSYRVAAGLQARELAAELQGSRKRYEPMVWK